MNSPKIIFYDFEVFTKADFWCVVLIDYETRNKTIIQDNREELLTYYTSHKDDIWVGYNSRNYDQYILKGILCKMSPAFINDELILKGKKGYQIVRNGNKYPLNNFDVSNKLHSLKQLEGFMGSRIKETSVDFNTDRKLTTDEIHEIIEYCIHDVEQCIEVFENKREEYDSQLALIEAFELPMAMFNKTKAQLSAHILGAINQTSLDDEFDISIPDTLIISEKYKPIIEWYKRPENLNYKKALKSDSNQDARSLETIVAGVPHTFAWGGLHGAISNYYDEGILLCADVASLYPSIMIEYGYMSRNILKPEKYKEIRDTRLIMKKAKDKRQLPYKIVLNSTYGAMKDKNNALYDPLMANNVCVAGQLLLLDLIEKVEPYGMLIQSNTDGIFMKVKDMETVELIKKVANEWERRTRLDLEWDIFSRIYQKDVNNYIIISSNGKYKSKGSYVKKLSKVDYNMPIVNKALIEYFVNGTSMEDYINSVDDLIEYQRVVKISNKFNNAQYGDEPLKEKVVRVFASTSESSKSISKTKTDKGEIKLVKIENTPDKCVINNDNVVDKKVTSDLDKNYYIELSKKKLDDYLSKEEEKFDDLPDRLFYTLQKSDSFYQFLELCKADSIWNQSLEKYIRADCCKSFGGSLKLINYIELFKILYSKKSMRKDLLEKKIVNTHILEIVRRNCEQKEGSKTYKFVDTKQMLIDIWDSMVDEELPYYEIIQSQIELFDSIRYVNSKIDNSTLFVINYFNNIYPSITTYCVNNGEIKNYRVYNNSFDIIPLQDGDVISVSSFDILQGQKIIGKDSTGKNIIAIDENKNYPMIVSYEIVHRTYKKNTKLISDELGD